MAKRKRAVRRKTATEPWDRPPPSDAPHHSLTPAQKATAKRRAKKAGRPYPNLVDNLRAVAPKKKMKRGRR